MLSTAAGSIWLSYKVQSGVRVTGAAISGLGQIGTFLSPIDLPLSSNCGIPNLAIGPAGQVVASYVNIVNSYGITHIAVNTNGVSNTNWQHSITISNSMSNTQLPAAGPTTPQQSYIAYDMSLGTHRGRLYRIYTDMLSGYTNDTNIYFSYSDSNGATNPWSNPVKISNDTSHKSQFIPGISVDPGTGNLAVYWLDCRNDATANKATQCFGVISRDGGAHFTTNFQICPGQSDINLLPWSNWFGYGDYTGIDYRDGFINYLWTDNSNRTGDNPPYDHSMMDLLWCRYAY